MLLTAIISKKLPLAVKRDHTSLGGGRDELHTRRCRIVTSVDQSQAQEAQADLAELCRRRACS
jgi:hypothetical protein